MREKRILNEEQTGARAGAPRRSRQSADLRNLPRRRHANLRVTGLMVKHVDVEKGHHPNCPAQLARRYRRAERPTRASACWRSAAWPAATATGSPSSSTKARTRLSSPILGRPQAAALDSGCAPGAEAGGQSRRPRLPPASGPILLRRANITWRQEVAAAASRLRRLPATPTPESPRSTPSSRCGGRRSSHSPN